MEIEIKIEKETAFIEYDNEYEGKLTVSLPKQETTDNIIDSLLSYNMVICGEILNKKWGLNDDNYRSNYTYFFCDDLDKLKRTLDDEEAKIIWTLKRVKQNNLTKNIQNILFKNQIEINYHKI